MKNIFSFHAFVTYFFIAMCVACSGHYEQAETEKAALSDTTSVTGLAGDSVKLVKTAGIHFKVKQVEQATKDVAALAGSYGGMLFSYQLNSSDMGSNEMKISRDSLMVITVYSPQASVVVRVPSHKLEEFMFNVANLGYFTGSSNLSIEDKSLAYLQNALKQKNRTEALAQNAKQKKPAGTRGTIEVKDEAIQQHIANKQIDADANYSLVNLSLHQNPVVKKEVIANYHITDYELPFHTRLVNSLYNGWQMFLGLLLLVANLWFFILLGALLLLAYKLYKKKRVVVVS